MDHCSTSGITSVLNSCRDRTDTAVMLGELLSLWGSHQHLLFPQSCFAKVIEVSTVNLVIIEVLVCVEYFGLFSFRVTMMIPTAVLLSKLF